MNKELLRECVLLSIVSMGMVAVMAVIRADYALPFFFGFIGALAVMYKIVLICKE